MYVRSLLAASALSLNAAAFLLVPEVIPPIHDGEDAPIPHISHAVDTQHAQTEQIQLTCDECPFPTADSEGFVSWSSDTKSSLEFNFFAEDGKLFVNDALLFPPVPTVPVDVKAVQRRDADGETTEPLNLGFALVAVPLAPPQDDMELMQIRFSPLDIEGHPVPLDTISLTVVKTASGDLFLARTEIEPPAGQDDHESWEKCNGDVRCLRRLIFVRIQALVQSAKAHMMNLKAKLMFGGKGCHGKPRAGHMKHGHHDMESASEHPHHMGPNGHPHHHRHAWRRTFLRIVRFIVVPAILGVLAGLTASAVGMIVGQLIVFVWMRFRRNTTSRSTSALEQGTVSEKETLIAQDAQVDDLPPYSDEDQSPPADTK
ncbi:hypothetical protein PISL3812_04185 [Talaromyces islandicus]|uniref:DUF7728 domain-containing protein n=1 Tax=Talaromyces islandicus TaxID=28573 RepID=A0A0U1LUT1_TALIS|nr:hypothetical protein PISL3812_04185 [Talaromyces islandicus]